MKTWTLEKAKNGFSEVVRRALDHEPQLVTRGRSGQEAVVVISREDYERLVASPDLYEALRRSPLARAVREGAFGDPYTADPFRRDVDFGRDPGLTGP
jgi:prevent-host-death family protein